MMEFSGDDGTHLGSAQGMGLIVTFDDHTGFEWVGVIIKLEE